MTDLVASARALEFVSVPSLETMRHRFLLATGTEYERWAADAALIACIHQQAKSLNEAARLSATEPSEALDFLSGSLPVVHESLSHLRAAVFFEAARNLRAKQRRQKK